MFNFKAYAMLYSFVEIKIPRVMTTQSLFGSYSHHTTQRLKLMRNFLTIINCILNDYATMAFEKGLCFRICCALLGLSFQTSHKLSFYDSWNNFDFLIIDDIAWSVITAKKAFPYILSIWWLRKNIRYYLSL